jgi:hypothetical protein
MKKLFKRLLKDLQDFPVTLLFGKTVCNLSYGPASSKRFSGKKKSEHWNGQ